MEKKDHNTELAKWLKGGLSDEEFAKTTSRRDLIIYKAIMDETGAWSLPILNREKLYSDLQEKIHSNRKIVPFYQRYNLAIAACVILLIASTLIFMIFGGSDTINYKTEYGQQKSFILPDGSQAYLNGNSSLAFKKDNWEENRQLRMTGEVYFKVMKGEKFTVKTELGDVAVLGTRFSVNNRDSYFTVKCYEGLVGVTANDTSTNLRAGQILRLEESQLLVSELGNGNEPSWLQQESTKFKNALLGEVFAAVEAQFGVELVVESDVNLERKFSGAFVHSNVETALMMICNPLSLAYAKKGETTYLISSKEP